MRQIFTLFVFAFYFFTGCSHMDQHNRVSNADDSLKLSLSRIPIVSGPYYFQNYSQATNDKLTIPQYVVERVAKDSPSTIEDEEQHFIYPGINELPNRKLFAIRRFYLRDSVECILTIDDTDWCRLISFRKGKTMSVLEGIFGLQTKNDTLVTWWWYASNEVPDFSLWATTKSGHFKRISEGQEVPDVIAELVNELGGQIEKE
jgi:hypothetical protein